MSAWDAPHPATARPAPRIGRLVEVQGNGATVEEMAAIAAAIEALWPKPVVAVARDDPRRGAWRFSGRWWNRPVAARRSRPWY